MKHYNPFVVGLDDRDGARADDLEFFDGKDRLVRRPIAEFDGHPLSHGRRYFIPALALVAIAIASPLLPFYGIGTWRAFAMSVGAFVIFAAILAGVISYHLNNIRKDYATANRELMVTDFLVKAQGVRKMIYMFKIVVRWRRFLRYTLNLGLVLLCAVFALAIFGHTVQHGSIQTEEFVFTVIFFGIGFVFISLFEVARAVFTQGMDPTLALILMVEDVGEQLLAARRGIGTIRPAGGAG